jgi:pimeloyl-ACP methyl ester carboxylesterase
VIAVWEPDLDADQPYHRARGNFRVIAMDQRNAGGQFRAPTTAEDGWDAYTTADHIALLDHLRVDRCRLYGQRIGGSFVLNLIKAPPKRVQPAVLAQPIGHVGAMAPGRPARFDAWAESLKDHPEATGARRALPEPLRPQLLILCRSRLRLDGPHLVAGNNEAHPYATSEQLSKLILNYEFIPEWKSGTALTSAKTCVRGSFTKHTPSRRSPGGLASRGWRARLFRESPACRYG